MPRRLYSVLAALFLIACQVVVPKGPLYVDFQPSPLPFGFVQFCFDAPRHALCLPEEIGPLPNLDKKAYEHLVEVNSLVNRFIIPADDWDTFGTIEYWAPIPGQYDDCDGYVIAKYNMLVMEGWPSYSLRVMWLDIIKGNEDHLVLSVDTLQGTVILDSRESLPFMLTDLKEAVVGRSYPPSPMEWKTRLALPVL